METSNFFNHKRFGENDKYNNLFFPSRERGDRHGAALHAVLKWLIMARMPSWPTLKRTRIAITPTYHFYNHQWMVTQRWDWKRSYHLPAPHHPKKNNNNARQPL